MYREGNLQLRQNNFFFYRQRSNNFLRFLCKIWFENSAERARMGAIFFALLRLCHYFLLQRHRDVRHLFQFVPLARGAVALKVAQVPSTGFSSISSRDNLQSFFKENNANFAKNLFCEDFFKNAAIFFKYPSPPQSPLQKVVCEQQESNPCTLVCGVQSANNFPKFVFLCIQVIEPGCISLY